MKRNTHERVISINAINVNIRKLHEDAVIPRYATSGAAAFDLVSVADVIISPGETAKIPLGIAFEIPEGYVMYVMMRSGIALKTKLRQPNGVGVIDSDYRGEVSMLFDNACGYTNFQDFTFGLVSGNFLTYDVNGENETEVDAKYYGETPDVYYSIRKGDRIAQALIQRIPHVEFTLVDALNETQRGGGGFGSSGVKSEVNAE